mmetsp:Transcript_15392/g.24931  ORF Transcript_15392/g.24931 Transcript_15392/m.24931 type:complete len:112 (+) Transcript_15392:131-466(+)
MDGNDSDRLTEGPFLESLIRLLPEAAATGKKRALLGNCSLGCSSFLHHHSREDGFVVIVGNSHRPGLPGKNVQSWRLVENALPFGFKGGSNRNRDWQALMITLPVSPLLSE